MNNLLTRLSVVGLGMWLCVDAAAQSGKVEIDVREETSGEPQVCRIEIINPYGQAVKARGATFLGGWNLIDGTLVFAGRPGEYRYRIQHGPQFSTAHGGFTLDKNATAVDVVALPRHANLSEEGWHGGDLYTHGNPATTMPWLAADDLRMAVSARSTASEGEAVLEGTADAASEWVESGAYADNRPGSGLLLHHWLPPAAVPAHVPSSRLLVMAKSDSAKAQQDGKSQLPAHNEIRRIWSRDVPIWLASGLVDSIQLLTDQVGEDAARFEPFYDPDPDRFRGAFGPGRMSEFLYWQVLEAGLRIPPSAGSGFLGGKNWLGANRVYVNMASPTQQAWWKALRQGRAFVTSGPLLRVTINGRLPGELFQVPEGGSLPLDFAVTLTVSDRVDYLDVILNGRSLYEAPLDEHVKLGGRIPNLAVTESGWLVVRVITSERDFYKIATTAPFYIEVGGQPRVSGQAVVFFQNWLEQAAADVAKDPKAAESASPYIAAAKVFWEQRAREVTVP